jgi:protoporphyrinogen oxidase
VNDCIIIGAGISGVSFAAGLRRAGKSVLLVDAAPRPGGRIQTRPGHDGYPLETGSHTCYNGYVALLGLLRDLGLDDRVRPLPRRPYLLRDRGALKSIFSGVAPLHLALSLPAMAFASKEGKTTREYYRRVLGARNYDRLFSKAFRAVICQPADDYPATMLLKRRPSRLDEYPRSFTFEGGLSALVDAIIERAGVTTLPGVTVAGVRRDPGLFTVRAATGETFSAPAVALAVDPPAAAGLLRDVEPGLAALLATIPVARLDSLGLVVPAALLRLPDIAGIISRDETLYSAVANPVAGDPPLRGFTFHFAPGALSPREQLDVASGILGITPADACRVERAAHVLPSPRIPHLRLGEQVDALRRDPGVYLLGNYFHGLSIEDCVQRSRDELARFAGKK